MPMAVFLAMVAGEELGRGAENVRGGFLNCLSQNGGNGKVLPILGGLGKEAHYARHAGHDRFHIQKQIIRSSVSNARGV